LAFRPIAAAALIVAAATALGGCGDEDPPVEEAGSRPSRLTAEERRLLEVYEGRIQTHCVSVARSLVDPRAAPSPGEQQAAFAAADRLLALAARKPTAPLGAGQDLRLFVGDVAENLEGSNCDPRMIARLERGLARIPRS
jgi:hypothetical protein